MVIKPYEGKEHVGSQGFETHGLLNVERIEWEAEKIEDLLKKYFCSESISASDLDLLLDEYSKLKHLNSFAKQIVIRMLRSNRRFWGYKVDVNNRIVKPHILFLIGTLCDGFDYMNTSPLYGLRVLDIGCGALSEYGTVDDDGDLLNQFYGDRPPMAAEMLQLLGAQTIGIDPRRHCPQTYDYRVSYKHQIVNFDAIENWLNAFSAPFDVISGFNLFSRPGFLYHYWSTDRIVALFQTLRQRLEPCGLLYTSSPFPPASLENRHTNRQIFTKAGFEILHEGYYFIAKPN
ncbi:MAG TPA: hypothetical protein ACFE0H_13485 [Elainellaceae cyanobacterium]